VKILHCSREVGNGFVCVPVVKRCQRRVALVIVHVVDFRGSVMCATMVSHCQTDSVFAQHLRCLLAKQLYMTTIDPGLDMRDFDVQVFHAFLDVAQAAVDVVQSLDDEVALLNIGLVSNEFEVSACFFERLGELCEVRRCQRHRG